MSNDSPMRSKEMNQSSAIKYLEQNAGGLKQHPKMPNKINPKNLTKMESQILDSVNVDIIEELSSLTDPSSSSCDSEDSSDSQKLE